MMGAVKAGAISLVGLLLGGVSRGRGSGQSRSSSKHAPNATNQGTTNSMVASSVVSNSAAPSAPPKMHLNSSPLMRDLWPRSSRRDPTTVPTELASKETVLVVQRVRARPADEIHAHLAAAYPIEPWVEQFDWLDPLFNEHLETRDGRRFLSDRPGLGFTLTEQARAWTTWTAEFGSTPWANTH